MRHSEEVMKVIRSNDGNWKNLEVITKFVYGNELTYPNDERAEAFLKVLGLKVFTPAAITAAAILGYQLVTSPKPLQTWAP